MPIELEVVLVAVSAEAAACKLAEAREQNSHSERYIPLSNDHIVISQQALSSHSAFWLCWLNLSGCIILLRKMNAFLISAVEAPLPIPRMS